MIEQSSLGNRVALPPVNATHDERAQDGISVNLEQSLDLTKSTLSQHPESQSTSQTSELPETSSCCLVAVMKCVLLIVTCGLCNLFPKENKDHQTEENDPVPTAQRDSQGEPIGLTRAEASGDIRALADVPPQAVAIAPERRSRAETKSIDPRSALTDEVEGDDDLEDDVVDEKEEGAAFSSLSSLSEEEIAFLGVPRKRTSGEPETPFVIHTTNLRRYPYVEDSPYETPYRPAEPRFNRSPPGSPYQPSSQFSIKNREQD